MGEGAAAQAAPIENKLTPSTVWDFRFILVYFIFKVNLSGTGQDGSGVPVSVMDLYKSSIVLFVNDVVNSSKTVGNVPYLFFEQAVYGL